MIKYKAILFDFDGVLCKDYFYTNLKDSYPKVIEFINMKIFGKDGISNDWMRGKVSSSDVNKYISENTGIDFEKLSDLFVESVNNMRLEDRLLGYASAISADTKIAIVTNNMDVFNKITIKKHSLNKVFPVIVNSCDYGILKHDDNGRLFDIALKELGILDYAEALLIDDSKKARDVFENKGGTTFPYENYKQFESWIRRNA